MREEWGGRGKRKEGEQNGKFFLSQRYLDFIFQAQPPDLSSLFHLRSLPWSPHPHPKFSILFSGWKFPSIHSSLNLTPELHISTLYIFTWLIGVSNLLCPRFLIFFPPLLPASLKVPHPPFSVKASLCRPKTLEVVFDVPLSLQSYVLSLAQCCILSSTFNK